MRKQKNKKSQKLQTLIMKNYLIFTVVYLICYILLMAIVIYGTGILETRENKKWEKLLIPDLDQKAYEQIDWSGVESSSSGVEILDENLKVVFEKGVKFHSGSSYTVKELFDLIQLPIEHNETSKVGLVSFDIGIAEDYSSEDPLAGCIIVYQTFYDQQGQWHLCLQLIPKSYLDKYKIRITSPKNRWVVFVSGVCVGVGGLILLVVILRLFSRRISNRIGKPITTLTDGLRKITGGDYSTRVSFEAENELSQMRDTFNYMSEQMQKAEAEKKYYEKERQMLFSNIAHDLKTPITTVLGYSKALLEGMVKEEETKEYLEGIHKKSERVSELINLLFTYTKLENQEYHLQKESKELVEFIRKIIAENYKLFEQKSMELGVDLPEELKFWCEFDPVELGRAITNLLMNAIKHNPPDTSVFVLLKQSETDSKRVILEIADDGVEIPQDLRQRLFEPFVLGDESRSSKGGNGLGLSISKRIIEMHGGTLSLLERDSLGRGAKCFRMELPIRK